MAQNCVKLFSWYVINYEVIYCIMLPHILDQVVLQMGQVAIIWGTYYRMYVIEINFTFLL